MVTSSLFEELFNGAPESLKSSLLTQYRMHPQIMTAVNYFYGGRLRAGPDQETLGRLRVHHLGIPDLKGGRFLEPRQHVLWVDSSLDERAQPAEEQQDGTSKFNDVEVRAIERLLYELEAALSARGYEALREGKQTAGRDESGWTVRAWLSHLLPHAPDETILDLFDRGAVWLNGRTARDRDIVASGDEMRFDARKPIGIISFYGQQLRRLRAARERFHVDLARRGRRSVLDIRTDTVDRFQGMERPIVIVSLVRAVKQLKGGEFVRDFRRINVALSRAQELLVIVGAKRTFSQAVVELPSMTVGQPPERERVYDEIFQHVARCGGRREVRDIVPVSRKEARLDSGPPGPGSRAFQGPHGRGGRGR